MRIKIFLFRIWHSPTLMTWGSFSVKALNALIILPVVLSKFTQPEVAVWLLFLVFLNVVYLIDIGFTQSFARSISYAHGGALEIETVFKSNTAVGADGPNWVLISKIYRVMGKVYRNTSIVAFGIMLIFGTWFMYKPIQQIPCNNTLYWIAWFLIVVTTPVIIYGIKFTTYLVGTNRIAFVKRLDMLFSLASVFCSLAIVFFKPLIILIVFNNQFWIIVNVVRDYWVIRFEKKLINNEVPYENKLFKIVWNSSWRTAMGLLGAYGVQQFTGIYLAQVNTAAAVSSYLLSLRIMTTIVDFSRAPFYSKLPLLSSLRAQGKDVQLIASAKRGMITTIFAFTFVVLLVGVFHEPVLNIIKSKTKFVSGDIWGLMAIAYFLERYGSLHLQLYSITNKIIWHKTNVISGIITVTIILTAYKYLGVYVFPLSMIAGYLSFYVWYSVYHSYKEFKMKFFQFETFILFVPLTVILLYFLFAKFGII